MTDIQAALGSAQMKRAYLIISERKAIAQKYDSAFRQLDWLKYPFQMNFITTHIKVIHTCLNIN